MVRDSRVQDTWEPAERDPIPLFGGINAAGLTRLKSILSAITLCRCGPTGYETYRMTMNWFVAWPVVVPVEVLDAWHHEAPIGLRFHDPADLHINLALLGRHDPTQEKKLIDLIRKSKIPAPEISLKSILPLPQPRRFSAMVWEIANGRLELEKQIAKWRPRICRELGAFVDASPALPHLTFARPERKISNEDRDSILTWSESFSPPKQSFQLEPPAIFKWSSTAGERQFEQILC